MLREKQKNIWFILCLALLFLTAMNFQSRFYYFAVAASAMYLLAMKRFHTDKVMFLYLLLSELMCIYSYWVYDSTVLTAIKVFSYAAFYVLGYNLVQNELNRRTPEKTAFILLITMALGSFGHYLLNFALNAGSGMGRNTLDVWTRQVMAATGQAALSCLVLGLAVAFIIAPLKKVYALFGVGLLGGIMAYNLMLAGRTLIVITLAVFAVGILYLCIEIRKIGRVAKIFCMALLVCLAMFFVYQKNVLGIRDYIMESNLLSRLTLEYSDDLMESGRDEKKMHFLKNMTDHPWGGLHMREEFGHAHDLLLDAYDEYGVFSLVLLVGILWNGIKNLLIFCRNKKIELPYRMVFLCIYVAIMLEFYVEPILIGMQWLFICFCMVNGCLNGLNKTYGGSLVINSEDRLSF